MAEPLEIAFDFSTVRVMATTYANGPQIVLEETQKGITRSVVAIEADAKREVPTDTHTLQRSLTHEVVTQGRNVTGRVGTNLAYAEVVEKGRGVGKPMPPPGALLGWMQRHDIKRGDAPLQGPGIEFVYNRYFEIEFEIARAIRMRGIKPSPYLKPAFDKNRLGITREMTAVVIRIGNRLAAGRG